MVAEQAFLNAILADPSDRTAKLIYADWLDDHGDPRAEVLRVRVRLSELPLPDEAERLLARLREAEATVPPNWLALLDGPAWCLTGNVVGEHPFGPGGAETRRGTRLFRPNARVYLCDWCPPGLLLTPTTNIHDPVIVIGQHRKSRAWIRCHLRPDYVTNWRVHLLRQPGPLRRLKAAEWPGFRLRTGDFACPPDPASPEAIGGLFDAIWPPVRSGTRGGPFGMGGE